MTTTVTSLAATDVLSRMRFIGMLVGLGGLGLALVSVITVTDVDLSIFAIIVGMSLAALHRMAFSSAIVSITLHVFVGILMFASAADLCATKCGALVQYETIIGIRTPWYGMVAHFLVASSLLLGRFRQSVPLVVIAEAGSVALIGSSVFFAMIMAVNGSYCAACFAAHLAMVIQVMIFVRAYANGAVVMPATMSMALGVVGALGLNAVFHHAVRPHVDSGEALVSYLRTNGITPRIEDDPRPHAASSVKDLAAQRERDRMIDQTIARQPSGTPNGKTDPLAMTSTNIAQHNSAVERHARAMRGDLPPAVSSAPSPVPLSSSGTSSGLPSPATQVVPRPSTPLRSVADINVLGKGVAPIELRIIIDPHCSACAKELDELAQLSDLIELGQISIRLMPIFRAENGEGPQAAATIMLAAGYVSQQAFIDTVMSMFRNQQSIRTAREAIDFIPKSLDSSLLMSIIKDRQTEIGAVLTDSKNMQMLRGVTTTPAIWLHRRGNPEPLRTFPNMTTAAVLRIAIDSVLNP